MGPWVGAQRRVPTPGTHGTRALCGALHSRTGRWGYRVRARRRHEAFLAVLEHLLVAYPQGPIGRLGEHVSRHTAHAVTAWWGAPPRIPVCDLPTSCSPGNPVEWSWLRLKHMRAPHRWSGSMRLLVETVEAFFTAMTSEQALAWAAA